MATVEWWVRHLNIGHSVGYGGMGGGGLRAQVAVFLGLDDRRQTSPQQILQVALYPWTVASRTARLPVPTGPIAHPAKLRGTAAVLAGVVPPDPLANIPSKNGLRSWPP